MEHKPVRDAYLAHKTAPDGLFALQAYFDMDARRLEFISRFIIAFLKIRSVN